MDFLSSSAFLYLFFTFAIFYSNTLPYVISQDDTPIMRICIVGASMLVFICGFVIGLFVLTNYFSMTIFIVSYLHFCFIMKKRIRPKPYILLFLFISTFFAVWSTVVFGKYYFENELVDVSNLLMQCNIIVDENDEVTITLFESAIFFFKIGFRNYFTLPDELSLEKPFLFQFIFGIVISGTIFSWFFDTIRHFIAPSESN